MALNGTHDDYAGGAWLKLNVGFITLAKAAVGVGATQAKAVDVGTLSADYKAGLLAVMKAQDPRFAVTSALIMNPVDQLGLYTQLGALAGTGGLGYLISAAVA